MYNSRIYADWDTFLRRGNEHEHEARMRVSANCSSGLREREVRSNPQLMRI